MKNAESAHIAARLGAVKLADTVNGAATLAGTANVIMQLARPGVGHGVVESRVESGRLFDHPLKRTRTTLTYLAVAVLGSDDDRAAFRRAVNRAHVQVYSTETSPVEYTAMDPDLQLWVAACLYRGFEDTYVAFNGPLPDADAILAEAACLGTTLQVRPDAWPTSRAAFETYWTHALAEVRIDDAVRAYLHSITRLTYLPRPMRVLAGFSQFVTTGFLPERFRREMGYAWTPRDQRRFDRLTWSLGLVTRLMPAPLRRFPYNAYLWDLRRRVRTGATIL